MDLNINKKHNMKIDETEFRKFIADVEYYIDNLSAHWVGNPEHRRKRKLDLLVSVALYKRMLEGINHHSSKKFKQLKIEYDKD